ncbi:MAG: hypothetical protein DRH89_05150 [Candidatus Cloacimonadota bacterium]|nr:MAG: hypothetical protein DRH89_05150 [Candidatus Cloacimonadota bacterium]
MNFAQNQSLKIFLTGLLIITITIVVIYNYYYSQTLKNELHHTKFIVDEYSDRINQLILEKVKTIKTITVSPILITALDESNDYYSLLSEQKKNAEIQSKDDKWQTIKDQNDPFILKYTDNMVSKYLMSQQNNLEGEYGEIFLTNKYGSLVASTAKLTTLAHGHKYWWKGAFNNSEGAVFFDDRGYDESVGGYVLGVVVPIKKGDEIIGILKANLNILGSISEMILVSQNEHLGKLKLIRSGGLIIFEEGFEPLSKRISSKSLEKLHSTDEHSYICLEQNDKRVIGISEIEITSGYEGYDFGGNFESIDHTKGNTRESWELLCYRPISILVKPLQSILSNLLFIGLLLSIVLAIISYILGNRAAKPIKEIIELTDHIATGNFDSNITIRRKDEIGLLAESFNKMAKNLKDSMISIDKLNEEINNHKKTENLLHESENRLSSIFRAAPTGIGVVVNRNIKFVNQRFIEMTGYSAEELIGKNAQIVYPSKEEYNRVVKYKYKQIQKYGTGTIETKFLRKDGSIIEILLSSTPLDLDDLSKGITFTTTDITERKKINKMLIEERDKAQQYLNITAVMLISVNSSGIVTLINPKGCEILGYTKEEIIGKDYYDNFLPLRLRENMRDFAMKVFSGGKESFGYQENEILTKSGEEKLLAWNNVELKDADGKIIGVLSSAEDITERKKVEEENKNKSVELEKQFVKSEKQRIATTIVLNDLNETTKNLKLEIFERKQAENLSSAVIKDSPLGISVRDKFGTLILYNEAWKNIWDITDEQVESYMIKRTELEMNEKDSYLGKYQTQIKEIYENGGSYVLPEMKLKPGKKKRSEWIMQSFYAIMGENNEVERVVILTSDISDRKKAEIKQNTLYNISNALITVDNLHELYIKIREHLGNVLDTTNFYIALYDEESDMISLPYDVDKKDDYESFPAGKTLTNYIIKTGKPLFANRKFLDKLAKQGEVEIVGTPSLSWLGVPLKIGNKVMGVIAVQSYDNPDLYTKDDLEILTFVSEEIALAIDRKQTDERIKRNLNEKDTLLRELYHRTKNNMQIISSMLRMQSRSIENKSLSGNTGIEIVHESFDEVINKIKAMSLVHQKLYQAKDLSHINLKEYITDLIKLLMISFGIRSEKVSLNLDLEDILVLIDFAVPLGLVLNELISNVFKHAFPNNDEDEITIRLYKDNDNTINIHLSDNGVGIPKDIKLENVNTMGLQTVFNLIEYQLKGEITYKSDKGLKWDIELKDNLHHERV